MAGDPEAEPHRLRRHGELAVRGLPIEELATEGSAEAEGLPRRRVGAALGRTCQGLPRLPGEAEVAGRQLGVDLLRGKADGRDLEVVDRPRRVDRHVRDHAPSHEVDDERSQADLQDVRPHGEDHRAAGEAGARERLDERLEVAPGVDVGERLDEAPEARHGRRDLAEVLAPHEAGPLRQGLEPDAPHGRERMQVVGGHGQGLGGERGGRSGGPGALRRPPRRAPAGLDPGTCRAARSTGPGPSGSRTRCAD